MNKDEAKAILKSELQKYRERSHQSLLQLLQDLDAYEIEAPSGVQYQLEIQAFWDDKPQGNQRIMGGIDDGGFISAFVPLIDGFILTLRAILSMSNLSVDWNER